jgi:hypothetical protein
MVLPIYPGGHSWRAAVEIQIAAMVSTPEIRVSEISNFTILIAF